MYDDRIEESAMDSNRFRMQKIKRLFSIAFYVCIVIPAIEIFVGILNVGTALVTLGLMAADPIPLFKSLFVYALMAAAFIWSYTMDIRGTVSAIAAIILWWFINIAKWYGDLLLNAITIVWLVLQIACLLKYKDLYSLKKQPGYPYFNGVSLNENTDIRSIREQQVKEHTSQFSGKPDIMDELGTKSDTLEENRKPTGGENHYMEDIFTDDLNKDI